MCLDSVNAYEQSAYATRVQTNLTYAQIAATKRAKAHDCIVALGTKSRPAADIPSFARLQLIAGDTTAAIATVKRYLALTTDDDSVRAERYTAAIPLLISSRAESSFVRANWLAAQLDSMPGASVHAKIAGHGGMLRYYRAIDNDDGIEAHAMPIIALAPSLDSASRQQSANMLILAYTTMAEVYGDRAQEKDAVNIVSQGIKALADIPEAASRLSEARDRYALIGMKGAPLLARYWLNADSIPSLRAQAAAVAPVNATPSVTTSSAPSDTASDTTSHTASDTTPDSAHVSPVADTALVPHDSDRTVAYDPVGHVTLVQFTAHWCGPCRKSYPAMTRLQAKYASRGYTTVFLTNLYGFMGDHEGLTPAQELAADTEYFVNDHDLGFPIGIAVAADSQPGHVDANALHYKVGGIPHLVLLDKRGIIRMIVHGWDPASEARLDSMIASLLDEKIVSR